MAATAYGKPENGKTEFANRFSVLLLFNT